MLFRAKHSGFCHSCDKPVSIGDLLSYTEGNDYTEHAECSAEGKARAAQAAQSMLLSKAAASDFFPPCPSGLSFYPFQRAGIHFALTRPEGMGTLFADEMGLGKTVQALGTVNALSQDIRNVLIVCPASLKFNWKKEAGEWLTASADIQVHPSIPYFDPEKKLHVQITNYDQLGALPVSISPDMLILDEAHYIKSRTAERTKKSIYVAKRSKRLLALTGTPIPNNTEDIYTLMSLLDPARWNNFSQFAARYCNAQQKWRKAKGRLFSYMDTTGSSNLEELQRELRSTIMIRRMKADVLSELPAKQRRILALPPDGVETILNEEKDLFHKYGFTAETTVEEMKKLRVPFEEISAVRKKTGLAKVPLIIEHVKAVLEEGAPSKKVILFLHHQDAISAVFDKMDELGYSPCVIRGETADNMRQAAVERFQRNPYARLFIGSIGAAAVGITLTASSHVIFGEVSWSPKDMSQAEDRAHRIGQKECVQVDMLVFDGSLDANIMKKVVAKMKVADAALDR